MTSISRKSRRVREPPLRQRELWKGLKQCRAEEVPVVLKEHFRHEIFSSSSKGELGAWSEGINKCDGWLRKWLEGHGRKLDFTKAFVEETTKNLTIPAADDDSDVLLALSFLSCLLEHSRNKALFNAVHTISLFLNSPSVDIVQEALMVLHWFAGSHRQRHQLVPFDKSAQHKLVSIASGWGPVPSLLRSVGLSPSADPSETKSLDTLEYKFFTSTYHASTKRDPPPASTPSTAPLRKARDFCSAIISPSGQVTVSVKLQEALANADDAEAGPVNDRPREILEYIVSSQALPFHYTYPLWTRLRMAANIHNPEKLCKWATCRMLALAVLASTNDDLLRTFLEHCSDWFQEVTSVLSDDRAPYSVVTAVLQLLSVLLSSSNARDALNTSDLRGSALSPSTLAASQGRLLDMLRSAPQGMTEEKQRTPDGALRPDAQSMYTALFGFASVFAVNQGQTNIRTLNTVIIVPFLQVPRLRVPGTEKVAAKCLNVMESLLAQDNLKEQVIEAGCTDLLIELLQEEVNMVDVVAEIKDDDELVVPTDEIPTELRARLDKKRRLAHEREVVLTHVLRALALCIGSTQGQPVALFDNLSFRESLRKMITYPQFFGQPSYKFAVHILIQLINTDHTVCPAVVDAGFLELVINMIKKPPSNDLRFMLVLPQLLVAFCLCGKGVDVIRKSDIFKYIFEPLRGEKTWFMITPSDAITLGTELTDLARHVKPLLDECVTALFTGLSAAVDDIMDWEPNNQVSMRPLHILQHHVLVLDALQRMASDKMSSRKSNIVASLLAATERICHIFQRPNLSLTPSGLSPKVLPLYTELKLDLQSILGSSAVNATWEIYSELEKAANDLTDGAFDVTQWETQCTASALAKSKMPVSPWPLGADESPLVLHKVATLSHLLHIFITLEGKRTDSRLPNFLSEWQKFRPAECLKTIMKVAMGVKKWQVVRNIEKQRQFKQAEVPSVAGPTSDCTPDEKKRAALPSSVVAALTCLVHADMVKEIDDPVYIRRDRIAGMFTDSCLALMDLLCRAIVPNSRDITQPAIKEVSGQLSSVAFMLISYVKEHIENDEVDFETSRTMFQEIVLGPWCTRIIGVLYDPTNRRFKELCSLLVLKAFDGLGGIALLCDTCVSLVSRSLECSDIKDIEPVVGALKLLTKYSKKHFIEEAPHARALESANRNSFDAAAFAKTVRSIIAEKILPIWKHPKLDSRPEVAMKLLELVGVLVKQGDWLGDRSVRRTKPVKQEFKPDEVLVAQLAEMGFTRNRARHALVELGQNSAEMATEWLLTHMSEQDEDEEEEEGDTDEVAKAIAMSLEGEAKEAEKEEEKEEQKSAVRILADESLSVAITLGDGNPALAFCATDILCLLADVLNMQQAVMGAVLEKAQAELSKDISIDNKALVRSLTQLSLLIPHNVMQHQKQSLAQSEAFTKSMIRILEFVEEKMPAKSDEEAFNKHVEFTKVALSVVDALIIPVGSSQKVEEGKKSDAGSKDATSTVHHDASPKPEEEWSILLKSPNEPVALPQPIAVSLLATLANLLDKDLPTTPVHQIIAILDRLAMKDHAHATQLYSSGVLKKLLTTKFEGTWPSHTVAGHVASIIKHTIEDPDYIQSVQEAAIRKSFSKLLSETPVGVPNGTVEWFTPAQLQQEKDKEVVLDTKDKKKKRSGKKKDDTEISETKKVPLVKLQPFLTELDRAKKKSPALFLTTFTSCCRLVQYTKAGEAKPMRYIELRPSKDAQPRGRRMSIRRKPANLMAEEIINLVLSCIYSRLNDEASETLSSALHLHQLVHLTGELAVQYPSTLPAVLASHGEDSFVHRLLNHFLPYKTSPSDRDGHKTMLASNAAKFVLQQLVVRQPEQITPEIVQALSKSVDGSNGMGSMHALSDVVMTLLTRPTKEKATVVDNLPPTAVTKELLKAGLINVACGVMKGLDLKHPNADEAVCSLMRTINAAVQQAQNMPDEGEGDAAKEDQDQMDCDLEGENTADDVQLDVGGGVLQVEVVENMEGTGEDDVFEEDDDEEEEEEEEDGQDGLDEFVMHHVNAPRDDEDEDYDMMDDDWGLARDDSWGFPRAPQSDDWASRIADYYRERHQMTGNVTYNLMRHIMLDANDVSPITISDNGHQLPFEFTHGHRTPNNQAERRYYNGNLLTMAVPTGPAVTSTAPTSYSALSLVEPTQQNNVPQHGADNFRDFLRLSTQNEELVTMTQLSYSADAVEDALGAYLHSTAPESVLVVEESQSDTPAVSPLADEPVDVSAAAVPNPESDVPAVAELEAEHAEPVQQEMHVQQEIVPEPQPEPEAVQIDEGSGGVNVEDMDLEEQLRLALGMSLEASAPAEPEASEPAATAGSSAEQEADLLASELNRALALSMETSSPTEDAQPAVVADATAVPEPASDPQMPEGASPQPAETAPAPVTEPALDPTFVAALPEDLRRDVLRENVHLLMTQTEPGENGSTVDPLFLAALPTAIQEEVIGHERRILAQRQSSQAQTGTTQEEIDPASFIVSLLPELRQEILSTSDDSFIAQLPPDLAAEAHSLREARWMRHDQHDYNYGIRHLDEDHRGSQGRQRVGAVTETVVEKGSKKPAVKKPVKQAIDLSVLASFVRVLYLTTGSVQHLSLEHRLKQLLTTVTAHPQTCRAVFALLLYILSNGDAEPPAEVPGAKMCIMSDMYNVPTYLAGTTPAHPLVVPPLVMLHAIDLMSNLADVRSQFITSLDDNDSKTLTNAECVPEACIAVVKKTVLFKLLELHGSPSFISSPKLSEALTKLIQGVCEHLCSVVGEDTDAQELRVVKKLNKERVQHLRKWHEAHACSFMECFDFDAGTSDNSAFEAAFTKRAELVITMNQEIAKRYKEFRKKKAELTDIAEPSAMQRLAAFLFAHPSTLTALVKVLEMSDTTSAAVSNCLSTLNSMCGLRLSTAAQGGSGKESVAHRLLRELLVVAERIATSTAEYLNQRSVQIKQSLADHLKDSSEEEHSASSAMHFFINDDPPTHEVQLQRLTKTLSSVSHHELVDHTRDYDSIVVTSKPSLKQLQGKWRTNAGNIVHVRHNYVVFERASGSFSNAHEFEEKDGVIKLMGCRLEQYGGTWCEWDDRDVWRIEDGSQQAGMYPKFKEILSGLWASGDRYLKEMGEVQQAIGEGFQPPPRVLPLVEAFFSFHEIDPLSKQAHQPLLPIASSAPLLAEPRELLDEGAMLPRQTSGLMPKTASTASLDEHENHDPVKRFVVKHKKLLNALIRTNPSLLSTSLRAMLGYSGMIDFVNKRTWFREKIRKDQESHARQQTGIKVSRSNVFHDSYLHLRRPPDSLKGKLRVSFKGEDGVDGGGLKREWFQVLAKEMFNPMYALFVPSEEGNTFQPNQNSSIANQLEHLSYFNFVGRVVGLAVYNDVMLDAYFTRSLYKHMLGIPPDYRDVQSINQEYYKNLLWMLDNDITDVLDYNFTIDVDKFGVHETIELYEGGKDIQVTNANKHEYVQLIAEYKMTTNIKEQITEFLRGFSEVVPRHLIQIFTPEELELLICGTPEVDVADWKANTDYVGYTSSSPQISWFWKVVDAMSHEEKLQLLQFITGTSKVPLTGFRDLEGMTGKQKFNIHKIGNPTHLPSSHTCFNQLDLPEYESYESLHSHIRKAVLFGHVGFGFI